MKKEMDIVFLLDRSGSMGGFESDTIGGYNAYLKDQKNKNAKVTTVLFDDKYEVLYEREDIKKVKNLTKKQYYVRGCTALLDAIGRTISYIESTNPEKVIFVITTDGYENASKEFSKEKIKKMIRSHKNWEFLYLGADIDSYEEGASIGIKRSNISNYVKTKKGASKMFGALSKASDMIYEDQGLSGAWKEELESYIKTNKESI